MKKPLLLSSSLLGGLLVCLAAAPALAQEATPPPAAPPPASSPPPVAASSSSMGGGTIGVGAVEWLSPFVTGGEFVYDESMFHIEAALGFNHTSMNGGSASNFDIGVAGWYHLAKGANADFSIGGGAGLAYNSVSGGGPSQTLFALEPGIEARAFLSQNFALTFRAGFAITFGDNNAATTISLGGQGSGQFGFVYFFR
ncbi:MAG TPA: hypothetical protein VHO06_11300 [Polyangia bacterium]|nr:hypothetical protein [Polyangia bacterium]